MTSNTEGENTILTLWRQLWQWFVALCNVYIHHLCIIIPNIFHGINVGLIDWWVHFWTHILSQVHTENVDWHAEIFPFFLAPEDCALRNKQISPNITKYDPNITQYHPNITKYLLINAWPRYIFRVYFLFIIFTRL